MRRLAGAIVLLVVTLALLGVCFAARAATDDLVDKDAGALSRAVQELNAVSVGLAVLAAGADSASKGQRVGRIADSAREIDTLVKTTVSSMTGSILYPGKLKEDAASLQEAVRTPWSAALQAAAAAAANGAGDGTAMASFGLATQKVLSDFALIRAGLGQRQRPAWRGRFPSSLARLPFSERSPCSASSSGLFSPFAATCCGSSV